MTDQQHPISPTPLLIKKWRDDWFENDRVEYSEYSYIATRAAQWGADQELEACCKWQELHLLAGINLSKQLRAARRSKPPSLKEQALEQLSSVETDLRRHGIINTDYIRRALEQLPE